MSKTKRLPGCLLTLLFLYALIACSDKEERPIINNEIRASIIRGVGDTVRLVALADSAFVGCSILGTELVATDKNSSSLTISLLVSPTGCVEQAGSYNFLCKYYKDRTNEEAAVFSNYETGGIKKGTITYTSVEKDYIEGHFQVTCQCEFLTKCEYGKDSVVIVGTFKANFF